MHQDNEDAETLRRVDALGSESLSQALREALARRSINAQQDGCRSEDAWRADEDAWTWMINDEANVRRVVPPFALLQLNTDVRRKVLAFLLCASQDRALKAVAAKRVPERPDAIKHETTRSLLRPPPKPSGTVEVFSSNGTSTSTVLRGAAPRSTAAAVSALFHHTAALRVVCRELRTDALALYSAANSTATPRSWLANLYCRHDEPAAATAILSELRGRVVSGRRANMVRELFLRKDACTNFTPPEYGRSSRYVDFAQQTISQGRISSRVMCTSAPSRWTERRCDTVRLLVSVASATDSAASAALSAARFLTVDEANRNAPVDEELLQSLSNIAIKSAMVSLSRCVRVTLVAESVSLHWQRGLSEEGGSPSPPSDCYPRLEEQLDQFLGDRSGDGWIRRWTNKTGQCYDDHLNATAEGDFNGFSSFFHDSSRPPITTLEDLLANIDSIHPKILTKLHDAFTAIVDVEFSRVVEPTLEDDGTEFQWYNFSVSSVKFAGPNTSARIGMIKVGCNSGAIDSVELVVPFFLGEVPEAPDEVGPGFFRVEIRARIPGFD